MKRAFTMPEILTAMMLLGFLIVASIKSFDYLKEAHEISEFRYLALNKIDSEMARVVMNYENLSESDFCENSLDSDNNWDDDFIVVEDLSSNIYKVYKENAISYQGDGLLINDSPDKQNIVEIKNLKGGTFGVVDNNKKDIVGLLGWKISSDDVKREANISLSITYPYVYDGSSLKQYFKYTETINLKTSTKIK